MERQLQNLLTYTVFHIGLYVSLFSALMGMGIFGGQDHPVLRFSVACFLFAGMCGAVIASNIPDYSDYQKFLSDRIGPWKLRICRFAVWATLEHLAFWIGVIPVVAAYIVAGPTAFQGRQ